jgi:hypothetical protein
MSADRDSRPRSTRAARRFPANCPAIVPNCCPSWSNEFWRWSGWLNLPAPFTRP